MRRPARTRCLLALALLLPALAGCGTTVIRHAVQKRLTRRLAALVGPAEEFRVRILDTPDSQLVLGRARRVEVVGRRINARKEFMIDSLRLVLSDLRYEGGEPYFVSVGETSLDVEFTDEALNAYLRHYKARYDPEVHFEPGKVRVKMVYPFLGTPTTLRAVGHFEVEGGERLLFRADQARVPFLNRPGFGERFVEERVNPLLDLGRIDFPARLDSVDVLAGRLHAHGTASIPRETDE